MANDEAGEGLDIGKTMGMMIGIVMLTVIANILPKPKGQLEIDSFVIS